MLIEADAGGERKVRTDAHEHSPPPPIIDVEIVLNDPPVCDLEMPSVGLVVTDGSHDAGRFSCLEDHHDLVRLCSVEVGVDELIATTLRGFHNRDVPLARPSLQPGLELLGNATQCVSAYGIELPLGVEEADDPLWLLERLDQPIQQNAIKAAIVPANADPVVFMEGVHERPRRADRSRVLPSLDVLYRPAGGRDIKGRALG